MDSYLQQLPQLFVVSTAQWHDDLQELHIDLQPVFQRHDRLVLTGWESGVEWWIVRDGQILFQPPLLTDDWLIGDGFDHPILKPWVATFPPSILALLMRYRGQRLTLLSLISRSPALCELFEQQPTLLWMLLSVAQEQQWSPAQLLAYCHPSTSDNQNRSSYALTILAACGLPTTHTALAVLGKIQSPVFCQHEFRQIRALMALDRLEVLNQRHTLPMAWIDLLIKIKDHQDLDDYLPVVIQWQEENVEELLVRYFKHLESLVAPSC
ncbi:MULTISPECIES: hypothetical protein [Methylomonas]|uniref:Uncharacterized protein n=2 Tax=Methylomonas TaxID=416 RepID=A0A126T1J8_9GAMM|nr:MULTISPECIES: hypothetical protein [Methylomonas]AMK75960.1 hypothetical protein JT25_005555 [Methylomonas denitrificans]OAI02026.1 hypothetical protein A1342_03565 [Methylomonas methanica]TCV84023.1 hypothetical protein EDE11_108155 [Methylomonas methanica]